MLLAACVMYVCVGGWGGGQACFTVTLIGQMYNAYLVTQHKKKLLAELRKVTHFVHHVISRADGVHLDVMIVIVIVKSCRCRSGLDQVMEERDKLRSDLADALSRNALMAAEVDERHAQLEKSYEARLQ